MYNNDYSYQYSTIIIIIQWLWDSSTSGLNALSTSNAFNWQFNTYPTHELTKLLINSLLKIEHWLGSTQTPSRKQFLNCTWTHSDDTWSVVIVSIQQCRHIVSPTHSYSIQHTKHLITECVFYPSCFLHYWWHGKRGNTILSTLSRSNINERELSLQYYQ